jgi:hypothetical protein
MLASTGSFGRLHITEGKVTGYGASSKIAMAGSDGTIDGWLYAANTDIGFLYNSGNAAMLASTGSFGRLHITEGKVTGYGASSKIAMAGSDGTIDGWLYAANTDIGFLYNSGNAAMLASNNNYIGFYTDSGTSRYVIDGDKAYWDTANYKISGSSTSTGSFGSVVAGGTGVSTFTGNVGIAGTPSAWHASYNVLQIENASLAKYDGNGTDFDIMNNVYYIKISSITIILSKRCIFYLKNIITCVPS